MVLEIWKEGSRRSFTVSILLRLNYKSLLLGDHFEKKNAKVSELKGETNLNHNRKVHDSANFYCGVCGNEFNKISGLNTHIRNVHGIVRV